jgi:predicted metal-dependent enzyme (double-stranded beta helix superfamily)
MSDANPRGAVRELVDRAVHDPRGVGDALLPERGGITPLSNEPDLTIAHIVWAPGMVLLPHDHRMWAVIGVYTGREDNEFYRRDADRPGRITDSGAKALGGGEVLSLGADAIHGVANTRDTLAGAIHVYGGDFVHAPRSQWGPGEPVEQAYDWTYVESEFERRNNAWLAAKKQAPAPG